MKLTQLLQELLLTAVDLQRLNSRGEIKIDGLEVGPYEMVLLRNIHTGRLQIGLTSHDNHFTNPGDQVDRPSKESTRTIVAATGKLTNKVKDWISQYGDIHVGSINAKKTMKYHNIFMRYGINCGEIYTSGGVGFIVHPPHPSPQTDTK
jgi:hypothetical protein